MYLFSDASTDLVADSLTHFHSWTAVVRGALLRGLAEIKPTLASARVPSRVARKHIGVNVLNDFEEGVHDRGRKYVSIITRYAGDSRMTGNIVHTVGRTRLKL